MVTKIPKIGGGGGQVLWSKTFILEAFYESISSAI